MRLGTFQKSKKSSYLQKVSSDFRGQNAFWGHFLGHDLRLILMMKNENAVKPGLIAGDKMCDKLVKKWAWPRILVISW